MGSMPKDTRNISIAMKNYDAAVYEFYSAQNLKTFPINSWDFYALHYKKLCDAYADSSSLKALAKQQKWSGFDHVWQDTTIQKEEVVIITDSFLRIVHASKNIYQMNGYSSAEVIGKKPKMFQGKNTCQKTVARIANAISQNETFEATILNYRKDGSPYNCWIKGAPIFNTQGKVVNFIAFEREVV